MNFDGKRILVTGGTGFIGGRLVERLILQEQAQVKVLVRNFAKASRISRFPIEMVSGDVSDYSAVQKAVKGCDIIFHCAYTPHGGEVVAKAALESGISRMVHVSTFSVYGQTPDGDLRENSAKGAAKDFYSITKLAEENFILDFYTKYHLPVSIIQPTIVYGPYADAWTVWPLSQLKTGRVVLVDEGNGYCNAVYVDDVVDALLFAATNENAVGQSYLISGESPVTWKEFYRAYENMLGIQSIVDMSKDEIVAYRKQQKRAAGTIAQLTKVVRQNSDFHEFIFHLPAYLVLRKLFSDSMRKKVRSQLIPSASLKNNIGNVSPIKEFHLPKEEHMSLFLSKTRVCIDKAKNQLGYHPRFNFDQGMEMTAQWAQWANLLNSDEF